MFSRGRQRGRISYAYGATFLMIASIGSNLAGSKVQFWIPLSSDPIGTAGQSFGTHNSG